MKIEATLPGDPSLARQLRQLDRVGMTAAERERAKDYLRRVDAVVAVTARAWNRARGYARRLRAGAGRGAAAMR